MSIFGAITALESFAGTLSGGAGAVKLGSVTFAGLEVPRNIPFGGSQRMVVHKLPGGGRVVDVMGRDDLDLHWGGYLEGPTATQRALALDGLRVAGGQITLSWDTLSFTVVVKEFTADYRRRNWIPYTLVCVVVKDNAAGFQAPAPTLGGQIGADLNSALTSVLPIAASVSQAVGVAQSALGVVNALVPRSTAFQTLYTDLSQAQGAAQDVIVAGNGGLAAAVGSAFGILGQTQPRQAINAFAGFLSSAGNLAGATMQNGFISRALKNLGFSETPQASTPNVGAGSGQLFGGNGYG